jgi:hypothetical protein
MQLQTTVVEYQFTDLDYLSRHQSHESLPNDHCTTASSPTYVLHRLTFPSTACVAKMKMFTQA